MTYEPFDLNEFMNMLALKGYLDTGLFHESQYNTPQLRSPLVDKSSMPHSDNFVGIGSDPTPGASPKNLLEQKAKGSFHIDH